MTKQQRTILKRPGCLLAKCHTGEAPARRAGPSSRLLEVRGSEAGKRNRFFVHCFFRIWAICDGSEVAWPGRRLIHPGLCQGSGSYLHGCGSWRKWCGLVMFRGALGWVHRQC